MACGSPPASSSVCRNLFGPGEDNIRSLLSKSRKALIPRSWRSRTVHNHEKRSLIDRCRRRGSRSTGASSPEPPVNASADVPTFAEKTATPGAYSTARSCPTRSHTPLSLAAIHPAGPPPSPPAAVPVQAATPALTASRPAQAASRPAQTIVRPTCQTSRFLALPQEIRDEIYAHVFSATRLTMGRRITCVASASSGRAGRHVRPHGSVDNLRGCGGHPGHGLRHQGSDQQRHDGSERVVTRVRPARHALALFYVCRQVHAELRADDAWLGQVLFNFEDLATMIDVLAGTGPCSPLATPAGRARVRAVRVREGGLVRPTPHRGTCGFLVGGLMRLLPGLRLDRLTVLPALPCRMHGAVCTAATEAGSSARVAPHDVLAELLRAGSGWRELCYVHNDAALLAADRRRPGSLEAMMVSMGYWDPNTDTHDALYAGVERPWVADNAAGRAHSHSHSRPAAAELLSGYIDDEESSDDDDVRQPIIVYQHRRRPCVSLGGFLASYMDTKEYRLPRWRAILADRDQPTGPDNSTQSTQDGRSTVRVYSIYGGQAKGRIETLAEVYTARVRNADFMVVVRRDPAAQWVETGSPYLYREGDPRTLGYGTTWDELRSFLFPWDFIPETRRCYDKYEHRDEYVIGSKRSHGVRSWTWE